MESRRCCTTKSGRSQKVESVKRLVDKFWPSLDYKLFNGLCEKNLGDNSGPLPVKRRICPVQVLFMSWKRRPNTLNWGKRREWRGRTVNNGRPGTDCVASFLFFSFWLFFFIQHQKHAHSQNRREREEREREREGNFALIKRAQSLKRSTSNSGSEDMNWA